MHPVLEFLTPRAAPTGDKADAINACCETARQLAQVILKRADPGSDRTEALSHVVHAYDAAVTAILDA